MQGARCEIPIVYGRSTKACVKICATQDFRSKKYRGLYYLSMSPSFLYMRQQHQQQKQRHTMTRTPDDDTHTTNVEQDDSVPPPERQVHPEPTTTTRDDAHPTSRDSSSLSSSTSRSDDSRCNATLGRGNQTDGKRPSSMGMQAILDGVLREFPHMQYQTSQWLAVSQCLQNLSREIRNRSRFDATDPWAHVRETTFVSSDGSQTDRPGEDGSSTTPFAHRFHDLFSWLFCVAVHLHLDVDRGWRSWCYKVRRKRYRGGRLLQPQSPHAPAPHASASGSGTRTDDASDLEPRERRNVNVCSSGSVPDVSETPQSSSEPASASASGSSSNSTCP